MHTLLDLRGNIPTFIHISDGKLGDVNVLDILVLDAGAIYVMDRGYLDFARLYLTHQAQMSFGQSQRLVGWISAAHPPSSLDMLRLDKRRHT